jgi:hypothetical protein
LEANIPVYQTWGWDFGASHPFSFIGSSHILERLKSASKLLLRFRKSPARCTVQQFDKSKETQLSISVPNPIMENSMNRNRRAKAEFLKNEID